MDDDAEHSLEEVVERGEPVHPGAPEFREGLRGREDAAEGDDEEEEEWHEEGGEELVGREGGDGLAEADVVELEEEEGEVDIAGGEGGGTVADRCPPPAEVVDRAGEDGVGDFGKDSGGDPGEPGVDFRIVLAGGEDVARVEEDRLELLDERRTDSER